MRLSNRSPEQFPADSACSGACGVRAPRPGTRTDRAGPDEAIGSEPRRRPRSVRTRRSPRSGHGDTRTPWRLTRGRNGTSVRESAGPTCGLRLRRRGRRPRTSPPGAPDIRARMLPDSHRGLRTGTRHARLVTPLGPGTANPELFTTRSARRNRRFPDRRQRAAGLNARGCRPTGAIRISPCGATGRTRPFG